LLRDAGHPSIEHGPFTNLDASMSDKPFRCTRGGSKTKRPSPTDGPADDARGQPHAAGAHSAQPGQRKKRKGDMLPSHAAPSARAHGRAECGDPALHLPNQDTAYHTEARWGPVGDSGLPDLQSAAGISRIDQVRALSSPGKRVEHNLEARRSLPQRRCSCEFHECSKGPVQHAGVRAAL
jgi:hypothetical protein